MMQTFWVITTFLAFQVFAAEEGSEFNYKLGGDDWTGMCASGVRQSPIDVRFPFLFTNIEVQSCQIGAIFESTNPYVNPGELVLNRAGQPQATFNYGSSDEVFVSNIGPVIVWTFDDDFSYLNLPIENGKLAGVLHPTNKVLDLPQLMMGGNIVDMQATFVNFHVHSPSEHMYNGYLAPLEGHFVMKIDHSDLETCPEEGCLSVVSVHFQHSADDSPNPFIEDTLKLIGGEWPVEIGETIPINGTLNFDQLLPENPHYMLYSGSLTTPPCTEGVLWHVVQEPVPVSTAQVAALQNAIGFHHDGLVRNNRRIQPLNDRELIYHDCI